MQIWRYALAHEVQWVTLSVQGSLVPLAPLPLTRCEGRIGCADRMAIIKSRQSRPEGRLWLVAADAAGVWGTPPTGGTEEFYAAARRHLIRHGFAVPPSPQGEGLTLRRDGGRGTPHPSASLTPSPQGEGFGACHSTPRTPQGEGLRGCVIQYRDPSRGKA